MGADARATAALAPTRLQRAVGVIYRPQTERISHYVFADVTRQFDALVHLDTTTALEPLDRHARWRHEDVAPANPSGV
jgi:erythromycin esterase-like protein